MHSYKTLHIHPAVSQKALKESAKPTLKEAFNANTTPVNVQQKFPAALKKREERHSAFWVP